MSQLNDYELEIIKRIDLYIAKDAPLMEKLSLARLLAQMDLEYDRVLANRGRLPARDVLRVSNSVLTKLSAN